MPPLSFGRLRAVVTAEVDGAPREFSGTEFLYFPIFRVLGIALLPFLVAAAALRKRLGDARSWWWLAVPPYVGLAVFSFVPKLDRMTDFLLVQAMGQMVALSVGLSIVSRFRRRRRTASLLVLLATCTVINVLTQAAVYGNDSVRYRFWSCLSDSLAWAVPACLTLLLTIRKQTRARLVLGTLVFGLLSGAATAGYWRWRYGPFPLESLVRAMLIPMPYPVGLMLMAGFNPWCRTRLAMAMGSGSSVAECDADGTGPVPPAEPGK